MLCRRSQRESSRYLSAQAALTAIYPFILVTLVYLGSNNSVFAADFAEVRQKFYSGEYEDCIALTQTEVEKGIWNDFWARHLLKTLLTTGEYQKAKEVYETTSQKFSNSIPLRVMGAEAYRYCGEAHVGDRLLNEIPELVTNSPWRYSDRENLLAVGKYLVSQGEDARYVLESCYDRILKGDPKYVDAHVAIAELALTKSDYQEAVKSLDRALELRPEDPEISYLLSKAWSSSDGEKASAYLNAALDLNPHHVGSLLLQARELCDSEQYDSAEKVLDEIFEVNAVSPKAWALKAAIAHLRGDYLKEGEHRAKGLEQWATNPDVDFVAGETLSKHYRFEEGVKYQRRALKLNPKYLPARFQLAQDLLRVGKEDEGWQLVAEVSAADKYNVVAFNLRTLQDQLSKFTTIEAPGFLIRMDAREAKIYGPRVVRLLTEAQNKICDKYKFELTRPTSVEIFPQQSDFAIRTFGLPGGAGYLGVCFGSLITANSPASQGESPSNWESVLWHEFCHVVTLQKTNNRMPRWLSEGISVYEELERDASWGQSMSPAYKEMLLGEDFVPLSQLSSAFMRPKSGMHLQFAYFESSLAVRYLIQKHGMPLMLKLLEDLGMGVRINEAFARRYGDTDALDADFEKYVKDVANRFVHGTDFSKENLPTRPTPIALKKWLIDNPDSYFGQLQVVKGAMAAGNWKQALLEARKLEELYPDDASPGGALDLLASIARELGDEKLERENLEKINARTSDSIPSLLRLVNLSAESKQWEQLSEYSDKLLAIQPLIPEGHEGAVAAATETGDAQAAIESLSALQEMDPLDPAKLHYQLSEKLFVTDELLDARVQALKALEFTPRYREAQKLLANIRAKLDGKALPYEIRVSASNFPAMPSGNNAAGLPTDFASPAAEITEIKGAELQTEQSRRPPRPPESTRRKPKQGSLKNE